MNDTPTAGVDSSYAWSRLAISIAFATIGGISLWSVVVVLPAVQADFQSTRASASLPYTLSLIGSAVGGVLFGRLTDRLGFTRPAIFASIALGLGYIGAAYAADLWQFAIIHGVLIALLGGSVAFGPLVADISLWFVRRRGIAVALCASGNYLAGTVWPPVMQHFVQTVGWRQTYVGIGLFCAVTMVPLALLLHRRPPVQQIVAATRRAPGNPAALGMSPTALQVVLTLAGIACCVAMAMPQVHIVAYCGDLGYGVARGADMLSLMLGFGIVSRIASGYIADRIGGLPTLLLGSSLQMLALLLYLPFDGLASLYVISALFGLFQGGIVPSYAIVVREYFPAREAGTRFGIIIMATLLGMALGGWMSGAIFDLTGSYRAAFANGVAWNLLNAGIALTLLLRGTRRVAHA